MSIEYKNRRSFLKQVGVGCAGMYATTFLSSLTNLGLINAASAANRPFIQPNNNYKALVAVFLHGGNDSYNMLIPRGQDEYQDYANARTVAAMPQEDILPINPLNPDGKEYGVHPNMPGIQQLFESQKASFVANVGTLNYPTTLNEYNLGLYLPRGLYSHSHQIENWQTSLPQGASITGWAGRMADILKLNNSNQSLSMNISLGGLNLYQQGNTINPLAITGNGNGVTLLNGSSDMGFYETLKRQTIDNLLDNTYANILHDAAVNTIKNSNGASLEFDSAISNAHSFNTAFPTDSFAQNLAMVAKTISVRDFLGVNNQIFYVVLGGFDTHTSVDAHSYRMALLDGGLSAFYAALEEIGVENNVTTFTMSDFARKVASNGAGTDHAWGGNALVMGGGIDGQKIFGTYPDLYLGNSRDTGGGRIIPTTSVDEYFAELALWFGASNSDIDQVFPNIGNFWDTANAGGPIGFMG